MKLNRRSLLQIATASAALVALGGRFAQAQGTEVLRIGLSTYPAHLRPWVNVGYSGHLLCALINRNLVSYDEAGQLVGDLAESWTIDSPNSWHFTLRAAHFSDGSPVTSADVEWTLAQIAADGSGAYMFDALKPITGFEVIDERNFRLLTDTSLATVPALMTYPFLSIIKAESTAGEEQGIGAGPYRIAYAEKGVSIDLEPNTHYFKEGLPPLKGVTITPYIDESARVAALTAGDVDLIDYVPWSAMAAIDANEALDLHKVDAGAFMYLSFNGSGVFADARLRQAVALGLRRDEFVKSVFFGYGAEMTGLPRSPSSPYYDEAQSKIWGYDPEKAKALLKEAGYENGLEVSLLSTSQYSMHRDTAVLVQAQLAEIGIKVNLTLPDWATKVNMGNKGVGDFGVQGIGLDNLDPDGVTTLIDPSLSPTFLRSRGFEVEGLSALLEAGRSELDEAKRVEIYRQADALVAAATPVAGICYRATGFASSTRVTGLTMLPDQLSPFSSVLFDKLNLG